MPFPDRPPETSVVSSTARPCDPIRSRAGGDDGSSRSARRHGGRRRSRGCEGGRGTERPARHGPGVLAAAEVSCGDRTPARPIIHSEEEAITAEREPTPLCRRAQSSGWPRIDRRPAPLRAPCEGGSEIGCVSSPIRRSLLFWPLQHLADMRANHHRAVFTRRCGGRLVCIGLVHGVPLANARETNCNCATTDDGSDRHR